MNKPNIDLEEKILSCWHLVDEMDTLAKMVERGASEDEMLNVLIGLKVLYNQKFDDLFETFSASLKQQHLARKQFLFEQSVE
jgi:hypothetical protein